MGTTLDIAIGLVSVYLLLSVLCSAIYEAVAGVFRLRAANLARSIDHLLLDHALDDQMKPLVKEVPNPLRGFIGQVASLLRRKLNLARHAPKSPLAVAFRQHPLIKALKHGWIGPSYIPSHTFVAALVDTLRGVYLPAGAAAPAAPAPAAPVTTIPEGDTKAALVATISDGDAKAALVATISVGDAKAAPGDDRLGRAADGGPNRDKDPLGELKAIIARLPEGSEIKRSFTTILDGTVKDLRDANARLERWFNDAMDRAAGRYKRHSQLLISAAALVLCVGFNADSVVIANALSRDAVARASVVEAAQRIAKSPPGGVPRDDDDAADASHPSQASQPVEVIAAVAKGGVAHAQLTSLDLQITWGDLKAPAENDHPKLWAALGSLFGAGRVGWLRGLFARLCSPGVLITTAAAALGAPFWFDLLNKLVNLRTAGKSPEPGGTRESS